MRTAKRLWTFLAALFLAACAGVHTAPTPEIRQALAPTGKLRVGLIQGSSVHAVKDPATGEWKGVGHDLGKAFAERLGVPFEPVFYTVASAFLEGGPRGDWDIAFLGVDEERKRTYDYAGRHLDIELGYLVPAGSPIGAMGEVDRPGVRVAVAARGSPDRFMTRHLKNATIVREPTLSKAIELVKEGKADVAASTADLLTQVGTRQLPGSRLLDGRPGSEEQALALPKGRGEPAAAFASGFIEEAKASGLVRNAIDRAGLRGASVAR